MLKRNMYRLQQHINLLRRQRPVVYLLNALTRRDFSLQTNIAYGPDPRHQLDVYIPASTDYILEDSLESARLPVLLFVHGGAWLHGSKDEYIFIGESFSQAGYVTVVINYRLAPEHPYPAFIEDTALAVQWINQHIDAYNGDPDRIILMGHSAGAFNVVEAVDHAVWLQQLNVSISCIKAVVGISGPYSFDFHEDEETLLAFDEKLSPDEVMPDRHVRPDPPPHLLIHATKDELVGAGNTFKMAKALRAQNGQVHIELIEGADHISVIGTVASVLSWYKPTRKVILNYLDSVLKRDAQMTSETAVSES